MLMDSFEVENFRSLRHLKLEKLARVNLLVGKNNSGKTSVLEALYALTNADMPTWHLVVDRGVKEARVDAAYFFYKFDASQNAISLKASYTGESLEGKVLTAGLQLGLQGTEPHT